MENLDDTKGTVIEQRFDLVSIGETMVAFVSEGDSDQYLAVPAGAESNVAVGFGNSPV